jgi:choline transport protein
VLNICGWLSICSGVAIQPGQFIQAIRLFFDPESDTPAWQYFLFYQAVNLIFLLHNIFFQRRMSWVHDVGCKSLLNDAP